MVQIRHTLEIPDSEFEFTFSRSGGPGGQHVNKVSSRVTLWFDLENTSYLSETQKARLRDRLGGRINRDGKLHVSCQESRSQSSNREARHSALCTDHWRSVGGIFAKKTHPNSTRVERTKAD